MIENSVAGLEMLAGEVYVTVNHQRHHQYALERYRVDPGGRRHVAVELGWCVIREGRHSGENALEVRLDGRRIGELTFLMSQRYAPVVQRLVESGARPGCAAVVQRTTQGLAVMLRLPQSVEETEAPATQVAQPARRLRLGPLAAGAVGVIGVAAALAFALTPRSADTASGDTRTAGRAPVSSGSAVERAPASTTAPRPSTTEPTTIVTTTTTPIPEPATVAPPAPRPTPAATCDPNYRGACVPVAKDVDCTGMGNGPAFVTGPVQVVGTDVYRLDPNKDGVGCG